jgi:hypothetical protein
MEQNIKLLDDSVWDVEDILKRMDDDSFYYGYLSKVALSSSSIKTLYARPKDYEKSLTKDLSNIPAIRFGRLFHSAVLEPHKLKTDYIFLNVKSRKNQTYDLALSENPNKFIMLQSELDEVNYMKEYIDFNVEASKLLSGGRAEVPAIGMLHNTPFRAKADYLKEDVIVDLKTTSNMDEWIYDAKHKWHYDIQAFIYTSLFNVNKMIFVILDKKTGRVERFHFNKRQMLNAELKLEVAINNYYDDFNTYL